MKITLRVLLIVALFLLIATCKKDEKSVTVFEITDLQVSDNSVKIDGKITSLSGNDITDYGVCYSVRSTPVATDTAVHLGVPEVGTFSASINNLQRNKTYYFRGFIREAGKYLYDDVRSARIEAVLPTATTAAAGSIAESSAILNGSVNANGVAATVSFEYGLTTSYGNVIAASPSPVTGMSATNVTSTLTGLASNTTYHYRVKVVNAAGTVTGEDVSFTTTINLVAPAATTTAATSITNTAATINGSVNANGSNTTISFEYGSSFVYGSVISASPASASSIVPVSVSATLTGLTPGQLYHFRVKAVSAGGTTTGEDFTFTTTQPPAAATAAATNITASTATLNGAVNAYDLSTNIYFEYGTTLSYGTTTAGDPATSSTSSSVASKLDLTGLAENTTYHFRIKAVSAGGTSYGTDHVLTTAALASLPVMYTELVTDITQTTAACGGKITSDGGGAISSAGVCWSTTSPPLVTGNKTTDPVSSGTFTSIITGLTAGTTYYIRSYATNSAGTGYGPERSFSTATLVVLPTITTTAITDITQTSATGGGNISSDGGDAVTASGVCWNTSSTPTISNNKTIDGSTIGAFSSNITGLTPGVTYYVRSYATNSSGTAYGSQVIFTTQAATIDPPVVTTSAISSITQTTATSGGNVTSQGGAPVTVKGICWNTTGAPTTSDQKTNNGSGTGSYTSNLTGLTASTTYYVRAYATNSGGTSYGNTQTFTTSSIVVQSATTTSASGIAQTTATLNGTVNANGLNVTVTFEYGLTTSYGSTITAIESPVSGAISTAVTANVSGLSANTQYNYRVKTVSASEPPVYGSNQVFQTLAGVIPTVTTASVTGITTSGATGGGNVTSQGSSAVTSRGACWNTSANPTIANSKTTNGTGTGVFTSSITGLSPNTQYHVRAYATNSTGTAYGDDITFTTNAVVVPPTVTTASVSAGTTTASTGGNVTNDGGATVTARGVCWGPTANPIIPNPNSTTDGTGTGTFTSNLAGLSGSTTYHVRAYATNSAGTSYGNDVQFTTTAVPVVPTVTTADISSITTTSAASGGNVTFDGNAAVTERGIYWGLTANPTAADSKAASGSGTGSFTGNMSGLSSGTLYHVRAYAINSAGTGYGNDISFTTLCIVPTVSSSAATGVAATTATLNGNINASSFSTTVTFEYGLTAGYGTSVSGSPATVTGSAGTPVSAAISGLLPNTLYHFRVNGSNCAGTVNGNDLTFTTPCTTATATVNTATGIAATSATIRGSVNANNVSTTVIFEYGLNTAYGSSVAASPVTVTGSSDTPVTAVISGLTPNTTYHYRVKTATCGGASYSTDQSFNTSCAAPVASTAAASGIGTTAATFNGSVNPNYGSATVTFDYGTTTSYGLSVSASPSPVTGSTDTPVSASLTSLTQNTTYHYRTRVVTCYGAVTGSDQVFSTACAAPTATTVPANVTDPVAGRAVLYGVVNGGGNSTTVQFDYGTTTSYGNTVYGSPSTVTGSANTTVTATINGLTEGTIYYFRVKATSCYGTVYGLSERFTLDINGNLYHIISYRPPLSKFSVTWMKENLRATSYSDLVPVPPGCDTCTMYSISYKPWGGNSANTDVYGLLYNGITVNSPKNICPTGWHVPTYSEWTGLIDYAGGMSAAGTLKETGTAHWYSPNAGATDFIGFSARGGGYATSTTSFSLNSYGYWWADGTLQYIGLYYNSAAVYTGTVTSDYYFYIRCKK